MNQVELNFFKPEKDLLIRPISRILVNNSFCPLRGVPQFLKNHQVLVKGERIFQKDYKVSEDDEISIDGKFLEIKSDITFLIDKPVGFVCSRVSDRRPTVYTLLPAELQNRNDLHTVGRLDAETSGLLIFTTNGTFSTYLTNPENKIEKKYKVTLKDSLSLLEQENYITKCKNGITVPPEKKDSGFTAYPKSIDFISPTECILVITEGRFHEVRRIFKALGNEVIKLRRISIGPYSID